MSSVSISAKKAAIDHNNSTLNIDLANVAAAASLKNGSMASTRFSQTRKNLGLTGTTITGAGDSGSPVTEPRTPAKPRASSGGRKDTPTKGATPTKVRKIKATAKSYKLDTIKEVDEEAVTKYDGANKQAKSRADAKVCNSMTASDDMQDEKEISLVALGAPVARGEFAEDGDEVDSDGIVVQEDSSEAVAVSSAPKAQVESGFPGYIIMQYDNYAEDAIYEDDETAVVKRTFYI